MSTSEIAAAHERMAEQLMSDERILGALPEDAAGVLLDWALARLEDAAASATDVEAFAAAAESIRRDARVQADAAADRGDDVAALSARLHGMAAQARSAPEISPPIAPSVASAPSSPLPGREGEPDSDVPRLTLPGRGAAGEGGSPPREPWRDRVAAGDDAHVPTPANTDAHGAPRKAPDTFWDRLRRFLAPRRGER